MNKINVTGCVVKGDVDEVAFNISQVVLKEFSKRKIIAELKILPERLAFRGKGQTGMCYSVNCYEFEKKEKILGNIYVAEISDRPGEILVLDATSDNTVLDSCDFEKIVAISDYNPVEHLKYRDKGLDLF